jgi:hypothetical protein
VSAPRDDEQPVAGCAADARRNVDIPKSGGGQALEQFLSAPGPHDELRHATVGGRAWQAQFIVFNDAKQARLPCDSAGELKHSARSKIDRPVSGEAIRPPTRSFALADIQQENPAF